MPLDAGSATAPEIAARVRQDLAGVSAGRFAWTRSRRYIYFEGRAGDTQNVWRITVDPVTEKWVDGPERLTTGAGEETNVAISPDGTKAGLHGDVEQNEALGFPIRLGEGPYHR